MLQSGGVVLKAPNTVWSGTPATFPGWDQISLSGRWSSYSTIYRQQLWVYTVVSKLAKGTARLPLKVYERDDLNRPEASDHPYARLLRKPNERHSPFFFWLWASSTYDVFGEFFLGKVRDQGGRPVQLVPFHPTAMTPTGEKDGRLLWKFENGNVRVEGIDSADLVHVKTYNPDDDRRGMSPLEPLRRTLEFEDAAQRAQSAFWRKGARPGVALTHPGILSQPAAERLKLRWDQIAAGADNTGTTVVLEEGMKPEVLTVSAEDAQYIESRKLNREEVCGAYDVPPPVVHILDRATFSNITEQMRSMYRDTMGPRLKAFESELETQLRGAVRPGASEPDFGDAVYAEFLLDEVLRGDFEQRMDSYQKADFMSVAEKRQRENLPFIPGTEVILVNTASQPIENLLPKDDDAKQQATFAADVGMAVQRLGLGVNYGVLSPDEARTYIPGVEGPAPEKPEPLPAPVVRTLMGRLSRQKDITEVDAEALTAGLNGHSAVVRGVLDASVADGVEMSELRERLRALGGAA